MPLTCSEVSGERASSSRGSPAPAGEATGERLSGTAPTSEQASGTLWQRVIDLADTRQLRALLGQAELVALDTGAARIRTAPAVAPMIEARRAAVESLLAKLSGRAIALEIETGGAAGPGDSGPAEAAPAPAGEEHPLVRRAAELFGAKVVHVEPLRRPQ